MDKNIIYRLADGRLWDVKNACWLTDEAGKLNPDHVEVLSDDLQDALDRGELETGPEIPVIDLVSASGESDPAYLARTLAFYNYPLGELAALSAKGIREELARLDAEYLTPRVLAGLATGDAYAGERWLEHERKAAPLRARLAEME